MYALVNTMDARDSDRVLGRIMSLHRTPAAAASAMVRHARRVQRANGPQSYLPMAAYLVFHRIGRGRILHAHEAVWTDVSE